MQIDSLIEFQKKFEEIPKIGKDKDVSQPIMLQHHLHDQV